MAQPKRAAAPATVDPAPARKPKAARKRKTVPAPPAAKPKKRRATKPAKRPKKLQPLPRTTIGGILEPDWARLSPDRLEQTTASEHWCRVASEMEQLQILSASNGHAVQRLVMAYLVYDRCSLAVAADGLVTAKNPDNPKSIERLSIHYKAMREAENTAERLEGQLGLTPGKRGKVGKVTKHRERQAGADAYLGPKG